MESGTWAREPGRGAPPEAAHPTRRGVLGTAGTGVVAGALAAAGLGGLGTVQAHADSPARSGTSAGSGGGRIGYTLPEVAFGDTATQQLLGTAYESALTDLFGINTAYADPATYDAAGLVTYPSGSFVRAGGGYPSPQRWTRDAAVNAWNATSLLAPVIGRNTLWAVVDRGDDGLVVQQDNQWWDQVVWVLGAWHHYLVTGDREFLADAYRTAAGTLAIRRAKNFDTALGLYRGPSFMNDGIAGYPAPPWTAGVDSSFVLDYPHTDELMCLSTNCLYYGAHRAAGDMAQALGHPSEAAAHRAAAGAVRAAIDTHLWRADAGTYGYFVHGGDALSGRLDTSQEGAGLAFAVLLGVADAARAAQVVAGAHWQPHGIVNVWPHFDRFSDAKPGRHNVTVWPMVHSMFGHAAAVAGQVDLFARAVRELAALVQGSGNSFYELYDSNSGAVDGGWQTGGDGTQSHFTSQPDQAWSATGYLRMILAGLFGVDCTEQGLRLSPTLPAGWGPATLRGLPYRAATVDVVLKGAGARVRACTVDGRRAAPLLPAGATGHHTVEITLGG
ncbi:MGH1-like glycoside hydrolase domain-containing protein [Actinacidiphila sp. bgisy144]|uniref:MGH1-like glycoside hydrolase domain-containing protein n=1 Tax=Actinacidiphila sp. bgisy144 TaxID=3413791 RepID=UPI003EC0F4BE